MFSRFDGQVQQPAAYLPVPPAPHVQRDVRKGLDALGLPSHGSSSAPIRSIKSRETYFTNHSHCSSVSGTTESRPIFTSGESANSASASIAPSVLSVLHRLPTLTLTTGTFGSLASTLVTVPVPTAERSSPV